MLFRPWIQSTNAAIALLFSCVGGVVAVVGSSYNFGAAVMNNTNAIATLARREDRLEQDVADINRDRKASREILDVRLSKIEQSTYNTATDVSWIKRELEALKR